MDSNIQKQDGKYFGIPVWVKDDGVGCEMWGKNRFYDKLIPIATFYEQLLNGFCSFFFDDYEPHFRIKVRDNDKTE